MSGSKVCLAVLLLLSLPGGALALDPVPAMVPATAPAPVRVVLALRELKSAVSRRVDEAARAQAAASGVRLTVVDGAGDGEKQYRAVFDALEKGADAVVLDALDEPRARQIAALTRGHDIPLIGLDGTAPPGTAVRVAPDYYDLGRRMAREAARMTAGRGRIFVLTGTPGSLAARELQRGIDDELALFPDIQVIARADAAWSRPLAYRSAASVLKGQGSKATRVHVILAHNDAMALGAVAAAASVPTRNRPLIIGADAEPEATAALRHGALAATADKHPDRVAREAIHLAARLARRQSVTARNVSGRPVVLDGVPSVNTPVELIVAEELTQSARLDRAKEITRGKRLRAPYRERTPARQRYRR